MYSDSQGTIGLIDRLFKTDWENQANDVAIGQDKNIETDFFSGTMYVVKR